MKIRLGDLKKIIKEEVEKTLTESATLEDVEKVQSAFESLNPGTLPFLLWSNMKRSISTPQQLETYVQVWNEVGSGASSLVDAIKLFEKFGSHYDRILKPGDEQVVRDLHTQGITGDLLKSVAMWKPTPKPTSPSTRDPNDPYADVPYIGGGKSGARYTGD